MGVIEPVRRDPGQFGKVGKAERELGLDGMFELVEHGIHHPGPHPGTRGRYLGHQEDQGHRPPPATDAAAPPGCPSRKPFRTWQKSGRGVTHGETYGTKVKA